MSEPNPSLSLEEIRSEQYKTGVTAAYENDLKRLHKRLNEFVQVSCPACGADDATYAFEKYQCNFVECKKCSTLYMSPRPTPEIMNEYYSNSENYAFWNKHIFPKSEANRRQKICKPNLEFIINTCRTNGMQRPHLLEVGPGFGTFASLAKEFDYFGEITVVERTPEMVDACRSRGLNVIDASLEELGDDHKFSADIVVCFEVIEHIFDPVDFLSSVNRLLKPGGLFVFTCPNGQGFDTMMLQSSSPSVDTEHVNLFNTNSIAILLERAGLDLITVETPGRLDVELVRKGVLDGELQIANQFFWKKLLLDDFETLGQPFQKFLVANNLSGNMRVGAKKSAS